MVENFEIGRRYRIAYEDGPGPLKVVVGQVVNLGEVNVLVRDFALPEPLRRSIVTSRIAEAEEVLRCVSDVHLAGGSAYEALRAWGAALVGTGA